MAAIISDYHNTMFAPDQSFPSHCAPPPPSPRPHPQQVPPGTPPALTSAAAPGRTEAPNIRQHFASQQNFSPNDDSQRQARTALSSPAGTSQIPHSRSVQSLSSIPKYTGKTIKVRDLAHIQTFASSACNDENLKYEISGMPITDIIEMVAGLLTKITTTNDRQHENLHRQIPQSNDSSMTPTTNSVLAFHGKNVPSITILSYLSRIHKYCPTTYEVFLSLLVYFDRMTERVNAGPMSRLEHPDTEEGVMEGIESEEGFNMAHFFVVDSFNIHRLVIAGVTCASKFFSDVFYTNSRYAKVRGFHLFRRLVYGTN